MKKVLSIMTLSALSVVGMAQNSAIYKADASINKGDYNGAINILNEALQNPKTTKLNEVYRKLGQSHGMLFNPEFLKASQKVPFDTLSFIKHLDGAVENFTKSHEADITPDAKGKVKSKFVEENKKNIQQMLSYYLYAGIFANEMKNTQMSRDYFVKFLELPKNPVFTSEETAAIYNDGKDSYNMAAYYAALQSNTLKDWKSVLKYADLGLKDTVNIKDLYALKFVALQQLNDTIGIGNTLAEAAERTGDPMYMTDLISYYMRRHDRAGALAKADELIAKDPNNARAYYMKGSIEMNMPPYNYEGAISHFKKALEVDNNYLDAYRSIGACYINDVAEKKQANYFQLPQGNTEAQVKQFKRIMQEKVYPYYRNAQPYFEKLRELAPEKPALWAEGLHIVYSNLLMQEQANEVKALIP